ncbi:MAG: hypothetical protein WDW38_004455 [Sanguina aurantia]
MHPPPPTPSLHPQRTVFRHRHRHPPGRRAREALASAVSLAALDGGMHHHTLRCSLLELAAIHAAGQDQPRTAQCLALAAAAASKLLQLTLSSHTLSPVTLKELPAWLLSYVRGQEDSSTAGGVGGGAGTGGTTGVGAAGGRGRLRRLRLLREGRGASGPDADVGR